MAYTIATAFDELKSNLEPTALQKETLSTRQQKVRDSVAAGLDVLEDFLVGSYVRKTMIGPMKEADIDIFIVLHPKYFKADGQSALLERVKTALIKTYSTNPKIRKNGQAVTITFTDFKVDVVPAFNRQGGGYLIPDVNKAKWIETNPKVHLDLVQKENTAQSGKFIPLVKMIKGWNRNINYAFIGFRLELLLLDKYKPLLIGDSYANAVTSVFNTGREAIKNMANDPAGYSGVISGLDNATDVNDAVSRFQTAYSLALKANEYEAQDQLVYAFSCWKKIFGDNFPTYG
ncbi:MAG: SMODS domain-containing nucleotidyltransferase [Elusimicrobiota bacterium]